MSQFYAKIMQKSSKLLLSLLTISGMLLNACGGGDALMDDDRDEPTHIDLEVDLDLDGKSGDDHEDEEEVMEETTEDIVTEPVDDAQALADAIQEDLDALPELAYQNGTYTATGSYQSPAGPEQISVSLTMTEDVVTGATVVALAENDTSLQFQEKFAGGVVMQVVGLSLDEINVGNVSGSSLTGAGFNSAVASIKTQAS